MSEQNFGQRMAAIRAAKKAEAEKFRVEVVRETPVVAPDLNNNRIFNFRGRKW